MFVEIALAAVKRFGVSIKQVHLDGSSMCVQGKYLNNQSETNSTEIEPEEQSGGAISAKKEGEENAEPIPIEITHGYSRDYRPDLKQFTLAMITSGDGDVPLYLRVGSQKVQGWELFQTLFLIGTPDPEPAIASRKQDEQKRYRLEFTVRTLDYAC